MTASDDAREGVRGDLQRNRGAYATFWSQRWRRQLTYSHQTKLRRFRRLLRVQGVLGRPGLRVFDQGFGLGSMLFEFGPTCGIAGLELSASAVDAARAAAVDRGFRDVDLRKFEPGAAFPGEWRERFDVVISSHVLEHIEEPLPVLRDLVGLLRPGGHACLVVPIHERPGEDLNHFHQFTGAGFVSLVRESGLEILEVEECDRLYSFIKPLAGRLQRGPSRLDRTQSVLVNAALAPLPEFCLRWADGLLARAGVLPCQCFVIARRPATPP